MQSQIITLKIICMRRLEGTHQHANSVEIRGNFFLLPISQFS